MLAPPARPARIGDRYVCTVRAAGRAAKPRECRHDPCLPADDPGECGGGHLALVQTLLAA